jgi:hypothetical protein
MNVIVVIVVVIVIMTVIVRPSPSSNVSVTSLNDVDSPSPISYVLPSSSILPAWSPWSFRLSGPPSALSMQVSLACMLELSYIQLHARRPPTRSRECLFQFSTVGSIWM